MILANLTPQQLRKAADLQEKIQSLQQQLASVLGGTASAPTPGKRTLSAAGREAIAAAARARWAKVRTGSAKPSAAKKPARRISAAGRERLAAAAKERWKRAKAAGKTSL
jgi:hypothetical protein